MDIKDFGKQLDGISSNNSFDNVILLPNDVANILPKCIYWNKNVEGLWVQNPEEKNDAAKLSSSFFITVKTNKDGLFINNNLVVGWNNKHLVKDGSVMYEGKGASFVLMETAIMCKFGDNEIPSAILFNIGDEIKELMNKNQSAYIIQTICGCSYWKKKEICIVRDADNNISKYKGEIMADEIGLYLDGVLRYAWNDYMPLIRKRDGVLSLMKKTELINWGQNNFYPSKDYFVLANVAIKGADATILIGEICKKEYDYDSLELQKDLPVIKQQYNSLEIKGDAVWGARFDMEYKERSNNRFILFLQYGWAINTNSLFIYFGDAYFQGHPKDDYFVKVGDMRFREGSFEIALDGKINYTLELSNTQWSEVGDVYYYNLNKSILRRISFAQRVEIKLKGYDCKYTINVNDLISMAKTFDEELYGSPKHEMDYYRADFYFEKNEYLNANRYILDAIKEEPDNAEYKELAEKIKAKLIDAEAESYNKAQKLFDEKKYEESIRLLDSIYILEKEADIKALRTKSVDAWFVDLTNKGDDNMAKNNTVSAINDYKRALKLHPEDAELKSKLQKAEDVLGNKMKDFGKKVLKVVGILLVLLIGYVIYGKVMEYKEKQEYMAKLEAKQANDRQINKVIETRLNEICKELSDLRGDTDKYLTKELKSLLKKGWEIGEVDFIEADIWICAQDYQTITVEILQFINYSERKVDVKLHFIDSWSGQRPQQTITFILEEGNWLVDDIIYENDESLKKYAKDYVNRYR